MNELSEELILGGSYETVRAANSGGEVHHIPAHGAYSKSNILSWKSGPAIWMSAIDHRQTKSWGRFVAATAYRSIQRELIEGGDFLVAQQMDIEDLRSKFDQKYDRSIEQAQAYTSELGDRILPITPDRTNR